MNDVRLYIFSLLDRSTQASCRMVCREWNTLFRSKKKTTVLLAQQALTDGNLQLFYLARSWKQPLSCKMFKPCIKHKFDCVLDMLSELTPPDTIGDTCCKYNREDLYLRYNCDTVRPKYYVCNDWIKKYYFDFQDLIYIAIHSNNLALFKNQLCRFSYPNDLVRLTKGKPDFQKALLKYRSKLNVYTLIDYGLIEVEDDYKIYSAAKQGTKNYYSLAKYPLNERALEAVVETDELPFIQFIVETHPESKVTLTNCNIDYCELSLPVLQYLYAFAPDVLSNDISRDWFFIDDLAIADWAFHQDILTKEEYKYIMITLDNADFQFEDFQEDFESACIHSSFKVINKLIPQVKPYSNGYIAGLEPRVLQILHQSQLITEEQILDWCTGNNYSKEEIISWLD